MKTIKNINNATTANNTFTDFVNKSFTFTTGKKGEPRVECSTTLVDCNFGRMPKRSDYKDTTIGKTLISLYQNYTHMVQQTSDSQRDKYANKVNADIVEFFKLANIRNTTGNTSAFISALGIKKQTRKDKTTEEKIVDTAIPSESTFLKNTMFCAYKFTSIGKWMSKTVANSNGTQTINIKSCSKEEQIELLMDGFNFSYEAAKACVEKNSAAVA